MARKKKGLSPIDVLRKKFQQHQDEPSAPKKKEIAESTDHHLVECYVCKNMSTKEDLYYVGKRRTGEKAYRHHRCQPDCLTWVKSLRGKSFNSRPGEDNPPHENK